MVIVFFKLGDEESGGEMGSVEVEGFHITPCFGIIEREAKNLTINEFDGRRMLLKGLEIGLPSVVYMVELLNNQVRRFGQRVKGKSYLRDEDECAF